MTEKPDIQEMIRLHMEAEAKIETLTLEASARFEAGDHEGARRILDQAYEIKRRKEEIEAFYGGND